jgi:hypothetical protein
MDYVAIRTDGDEITTLASVERSASQLRPATPLLRRDAHAPCRGRPLRAGGHARRFSAEQAHSFLDALELLQTARKIHAKKARIVAMRSL